MSITRIPDSILKTFECAECGRYLSSLPIGTRLDGTNICSLCYDKTTTRCVLFETLAALHTFPCNYRAQGCCEYLPFNNVAHHENNCTHRVYLCPVNLFSTCSWAGSARQIYHHYKKQHPELRLKHPSFKMNFSKECECNTYIVSVNSADFILTAEHSISTNILCLNAIYIGDVNSAKSIKYRVTLSSDYNSGRSMRLEESHTSPLTELYQPVTQESKQINVNDLVGFLQNLESLQCEWSFTFPDNLKQIKKVKLKTENIKCPVCMNGMVPPIYRCSVGHVSCNDCKGYENFCKLCQEADIIFTRAVDLEDVAIDSQHYCRWKNCLRCFDSFSIKQHEQECFKRLYDCPVCSKQIGTFNCIFKHFCTEHIDVKYKLAHGNLVTLSKKTDYCYIFASREIFKVSILEDEECRWTIDIIYYGVPSLNNWKYEVIRNCNAINYASKLYNNHYRLEHDEYSNRNHSLCYFNIRFIKQQVTSMMWMPYEPPPKKICVNFDMNY